MGRSGGVRRRGSGWSVALCAAQGDDFLEESEAEPEDHPTGEDPEEGGFGAGLPYLNGGQGEKQAAPEVEWVEESESDVDDIEWVRNGEKEGERWTGIQFPSGEYEDEFDTKFEEKRHHGEASHLESGVERGEFVEDGAKQDPECTCDHDQPGGRFHDGPGGIDEDEKEWLDFIFHVVQGLSF